MFVNRALFSKSNAHIHREKALFIFSKAGIGSWEYDVASDTTLYLIDNGERECEVTPIKGPAEYYIHNGDIHPDSEETLRSLYRRISSGEEEGEADIMVLAADGVCWTNRRISFKTFFDGDGRPVSAVCVEKNTDDIVYANSRYEQVLAQYGTLEMDCLLSWRVNLTQMRLEYSHSRSNLENQFTSIDEFRPGSLHDKSLHLPEDERPVFIRLLSPERMKTDFAIGKGEDCAEFTWKRDSGETVHASIAVRVIENPKTGELMAFIYVRDVSEKRYWHSAFNEAMRMTCDFVSVIDTVTGVNRRIDTNMSTGSFPPDIIPHDYGRAMRHFVQTIVPVNERGQAVHDMDIDTIIAGLKASDTYRHTGHVTDGEGGLRLKEWIYRYFDSEQHSIIYIRRDITPHAD